MLARPEEDGLKKSWERREILQDLVQDSGKPTVGRDRVILGISYE
jgi:hypothetical protein